MASLEVSESLQEWETVVAWDNHHNPQDDGGLLVFPPNSHEGLQIPCPPPPPPPGSQTHSQPTGEEEEEEEEKELPPTYLESDRKLMRPRVENLRYGVVWIVSRIRYYYAICRRGLWPFASAVAALAAAAAVVVFYWRVRRRRYWVREARDGRLDLLIKKKDQRINELLVQIAQMNEMLLARRKVAVLRIG